jgi:hypothetical protein
MNALDNTHKFLEFTDLQTGTKHGRNTPLARASAPSIAALVLRNSTAGGKDLLEEEKQRK